MIDQKIINVIYHEISEGSHFRLESFSVRRAFMTDEIWNVGLEYEKIRAGNQFD